MIKISNYQWAGAVFTTWLGRSRIAQKSLLQLFHVIKDFALTSFGPPDQQNNKRTPHIQEKPFKKHPSPRQLILILLLFCFGQQFILLVITIFFIQAFLEISLRMAKIDLFMLKFEQFQNPSKIGKIRDLERFLMEFQKSP